MRFADMVDKSYPTGSRYICDPAPTDTDNDILILVNGFYPWQETLLEEGWEECGKDYENNPGGFGAYRKGEDNYIVTEDEQFFQSYVQATEGAKALNLLKKEDRIALFSAVLDSAGSCNIGLYTERKARAGNIDVLLGRLMARPVPELQWIDVINRVHAQPVGILEPENGPILDDNF